MTSFRQLGVAWKGLWSYKARTLLAVLGIAISSLLVIFLVAVLYNFKMSLMGQIKGVGAQQIVAVPGKLLNNRAMDVDFSSMLSFTSVTSSLTEQDARDVREQVPGVEAAAPQIESIATMRAAGQDPVDILFTGTDPAYGDIFTLELAEGRFINAEDAANQANVVVLGHTAKQTLFGDEQALGKQVNIKGLDFTVIGVLQQKRLIGFNFDERVYSSYKVVKDTAHVEHASMIFFKARSMDSVPEVEKQIDQVLKGNRPAKDYNLLKSDEALHIVNTVMTLVTAITIGITGVSFLVGGIGIMNVMLLTVKERTREIGIRKAVGAKSRHILFQFLFEAMYISLIGCLTGLGATYGLLQLLHAYFPVLSSELPIELVGFSLVFSILLGLFFGLIPALKAIRIEPIEALRYE